MDCLVQCGRNAHSALGFFLWQGTAVKASETDAQLDAAGSVLWELGSFPNKQKIAFVSRKPCLPNSDLSRFLSILDCKFTIKKPVRRYNSSSGKRIFLEYQTLGTISNTTLRSSTTGRPGRLLIDIQAKIQAGKGKGYERWAKIFNLHEAAKALNFLIDNNLTDYDQLAALADSAGARFRGVSSSWKGAWPKLPSSRPTSFSIPRPARSTPPTKSPGIKRSSGPNTPPRLPGMRRQSKPLTPWEENLSQRCPSCPRNMESCWRKSRLCTSSTRRCGRT